MKAVILMFDSLNRHYLSPYGNDWVDTPNFKRLAEKTMTFDKHYAGSLPCIPARREMHTGRYNFLHRSWGPVEPYDESVYEMLKDNDIHSHLVTDHPHYWEDGGSTYHNRFSTYEFVRGQEGDLWKVDLSKTEEDPHIGRGNLQDDINRKFIAEHNQYPLDVVIDHGIEFIEKNADNDNWFLQIESFDPHEPFVSEKERKEKYPDDYLGPRFDWPEYGEVTEEAEAIEHLKNQYATLVTKCDEKLGAILDVFDEKDLWKDTALIVTTDHGFLLGEHNSWAKCVQPFYEEVAHIPLFYWDPRLRVKNERINNLTQTIDLAPSLLDLFDVEKGEHMLGKSLQESILSDPTKRYGLFGLHGGQMNITDGEYVYMRSPVKEDPDLFNYTLMPMHMRKLFSVEELKSAKLEDGFSFTKGLKLLKIDANLNTSGDVKLKGNYPDALYNLLEDPKQQHPYSDPEKEEELREEIKKIFDENDAPAELYERYGLSE